MIKVIQDNYNSFETHKCVYCSSVYMYQDEDTTKEKDEDYDITSLYISCPCCGEKNYVGCY